jgi:hypothetical protein
MSRTPRAAVLLLLAGAPLMACFALFPLDDYGPGSSPTADGPSTESGNDGISPPPGDALAEDVYVHPDGRVMFVSSTRVTGDFGSIDAGDTICDQAAKRAGLTGVFRAWLSDGNGHSPVDDWDASFFDADPDAAGPAIVTTRGRLLALNFHDLSANGPRHPFAFDENEQPLFLPDSGPCEDLDAGGFAWTNTNASGSRFGGGMFEHCQQWTSATTTGRGGALREGGAASDWTAVICSGPVDCATHASLYCFEQ